MTLTMMSGRVPAVGPTVAAPVLDEPVCIFAALIDSLTSSGRYSLKVRNGELFIEPARRSNGPHSAAVANAR
jgi:hypothetical protein